MTIYNRTHQRVHVGVDFSGRVVALEVRGIGLSHGRLFLLLVDQSLDIGNHFPMICVAKQILITLIEQLHIVKLSLIDHKSIKVLTGTGCSRPSSSARRNLSRSLRP
jgi:hypothetical protein